MRNPYLPSLGARKPAAPRLTSTSPWLTHVCPRSDETQISAPRFWASLARSSGTSTSRREEYSSWPARAGSAWAGSWGDFAGLALGSGIGRSAWGDWVWAPGGEEGDAPAAAVHPAPRRPAAARMAIQKTSRWPDQSPRGLLIRDS